MTSYVLRRLMYAIFGIWGVVTVIFIVVRVVPGNPASLILGISATPQQIAELKARLGLDQSVALQYVHYLDGAIHLNFGNSYIYNEPASHLVLGRLGATAYLAVVATAIAAIVSLPLAVLAARFEDRWPDRAISGAALTTQSLPSFWIGIEFILIFARYLRLLPASGNESWTSVILPAVTLAVPFLGIFVRLMRSDLVDVLRQNYIRTARAKGLSERIVLVHHATRNSLIPLVTVAGLELGALLGGAVVVENVFAWPGIGSLLVTAINDRDFNVVQASIMYIAGVIVVLNLLVARGVPPAPRPPSRRPARGHRYGCVLARPASCGAAAVEPLLRPAARARPVACRPRRGARWRRPGEGRVARGGAACCVRSRAQRESPAAGTPSRWAARSRQDERCTRLRIGYRAAPRKD